MGASAVPKRLKRAPAPPPLRASVIVPYLAIWTLLDPASIVGSAPLGRPLWTVRVPGRTAILGLIGPLRVSIPTRFRTAVATVTTVACGDTVDPSSVIDGHPLALSVALLGRPRRPL